MVRVMLRYLPILEKVEFDQTSRKRSTTRTLPLSMATLPDDLVVHTMLMLSARDRHRFARVLRNGTALVQRSYPPGWLEWARALPFGVRKQVRGQLRGKPPPVPAALLGLPAALAAGTDASAFLATHPAGTPLRALSNLPGVANLRKILVNVALGDLSESRVKQVVEAGFSPTHLSMLFSPRGVKSALGNPLFDLAEFSSVAAPPDEPDGFVLDSWLLLLRKHFTALLAKASSGSTILQQIKRDYRMLEHAPLEVRANKAVVVGLIRRSDRVLLEWAAEELRGDMGLIREHLLHWGAVYRYGIQTGSTTACRRGEKDWRTGGVPMKLRGDRDVMLSVVAKRGGWLKHCSAELRRDRDVVLRAVMHGGPDVMQHASEELRADRGVVEAAVTQDWRSLKWASDELRADENMKMKADELRAEERGLMEGDDNPL